MSDESSLIAGSQLVNCDECGERMIPLYELRADDPSGGDGEFICSQCWESGEQ